MGSIDKLGNLHASDGKFTNKENSRPLVGLRALTEADKRTKELQTSLRMMEECGAYKPPLSDPTTHPNNNEDAYDVVFVGGRAQEHETSVPEVSKQVRSGISQLKKLGVLPNKYEYRVRSGYNKVDIEISKFDQVPREKNGRLIPEAKFISDVVEALAEQWNVHTRNVGGGYGGTSRYLSTTSFHSEGATR